jgi:hypothetical protein
VAAACLLLLWVLIPPGAWTFVCCKCCVLSGIGLCDELITRPEESYRLWCVVVCDLEPSWCRTKQTKQGSDYKFRRIRRQSQIYRLIKKSLYTCWLQHTSFLPHCLAQSDHLAADRQGQGDTRLTLTPSVIPNSKYAFMVSYWNCLKYFSRFFYCNH